jgi:PAS domain S-box-containing protein
VSRVAETTGRIFPSADPTTFMEVRVLLVDTDETLGGEVVDAIAQAGDGTASMVAGPDAAMARLSRTDCVVVGHDPPALDGVVLLDRIRERRPDLPVVFFPKRGSEAVASAAITAGVTEYVERRDDAVDRLVETVRGVASDAGPRPGASVDGLERSDPPIEADGGDAHATIPEPVEVPEEVPFDLKERAMDEAPVGITISDPSLPDNPLIYINDAFERMTGYTREEALGTNCRFLQGEETDEEPVQQMREAVENQEYCSVELANYNRDGELFWNKVDVAPLYDENGEVTHFVGFQTDVTERKRAEFAVERYAERLDDERRALERILDRVNGLIGEATERLVGATSYRAIAEGVCELIADTDAYVGAWIGEIDLTTDAVVPTASAGIADPGDRQISLDEDDPVAAAVRNRELRTVSDLSATAPESWHADIAPGARSLAVVPLTYRDTRYGALAVYATDPAAVDERERAVLGALGRMIATAINAVETRAILTADNVVSLTIDVPDDDVVFAALSAELDATLEHTGAIAREDGSMLAFVTVEGEDPGSVVELAEGLDAVESMTLITESDDVGLYEIVLGERSILTELAEFGATTETLTAENGVARLEVETPHNSAARSLIDALEAGYDGIDLAAYRERERPPTTKQEFIATLHERLTERQLTALQKAYVAGYYDWPRRTDGDKLAGTMDISRTTFHQHLRAAERKLIEEFFADVS